MKFSLLGFARALGKGTLSYIRPPDYSMLYAAKIRSCVLTVLALTSCSSAVAGDETPQWLRVMYVKSTETDFVTAVFGDFAASKESNYLMGATYGRQIDDRVFDWPISMSANIGVQVLKERGYQDDGLGATAFVKLHYDWRLPWTATNVRLGFGEGLSYASPIPMSEQRDFATKDAESSKLMNYLEWTVDLPLTQFMASQTPDDVIQEMSLGFIVWHRSSVFGLFGEERGGVNFMGFNFEARF